MKSSENSGPSGEEGGQVIRKKQNNITVCLTNKSQPGKTTTKPYAMSVKVLSKI